MPQAGPFLPSRGLRPRPGLLKASGPARLPRIFPGQLAHTWGHFALAELMASTGFSQTNPALLPHPNSLSFHKTLLHSYGSSAKNHSTSFLDQREGDGSHHLLRRGAGGRISLIGHTSVDKHVFLYVGKGFKGVPIAQTMPLGTGSAAGLSSVAPPSGGRNYEVSWSLLFQCHVSRQVSSTKEVMFFWSRRHLLQERRQWLTMTLSRGGVPALTRVRQSTGELTGSDYTLK